MHRLLLRLVFEAASYCNSGNPSGWWFGAWWFAFEPTVLAEGEATPISPHHLPNHQATREAEPSVHVAVELHVSSGSLELP